jgi:hypothetical protein
MAHAQKPDFFFQRNRRVHLNRRGLQFSQLLAAEVCASEVVMLDTPYSEVVWRVLATHSIHQFPLHFPSCVSPCVITCQLDSIPIFSLFAYNIYTSCILIHSQLHPCIALAIPLDLFVLQRIYLHFCCLHHTASSGVSCFLVFLWIHIHSGYKLP